MTFAQGGGGWVYVPWRGIHISGYPIQGIGWAWDLSATWGQVCAWDWKALQVVVVHQIYKGHDLVLQD